MDNVLLRGDFSVLFFLPFGVKGSFWLTSLVLLVRVKKENADFLLMLSGTKDVTYVFQLGWSDNKGQYVYQYFLLILFCNMNG